MHTYGSLTASSALYGKVFRPDIAALHPEQREQLSRLLGQNVPVTNLVGAFGGVVTDYGLLSQKMVTNAGVLFLASAFAGAATIGNMKYHAFGSGNTAEAVTDTGLVTEFTTEYAIASTRPTGSQSNSASMPAVYTTIGTFTPGSGGTLSCREHGIFAGASGANAMWDRSVFTGVITLLAGSDSLQMTYALTLNAGG
jgi:hypothetical protein